MLTLPYRLLEESLMAIPLPDARELSDEVLEALRLRALHGCELGFTEADIADLLGVCRETVSRWWSAYAHEGLDALPPSGPDVRSAPGVSFPRNRPTSSGGYSAATAP